MTDDLPKLVRDRIPAIIRDDGEEPVTDQVTGEELRRYLADKLVEEAEEFRQSQDVEELADVLEVVHRWCALEAIEPEELEQLRIEKREDRGGFDENIVLRDIED